MPWGGVRTAKLRLDDEVEVTQELTLGCERGRVGQDGIGIGSGRVRSAREGYEVVSCALRV